MEYLTIISIIAIALLTGAVIKILEYLTTGIIEMIKGRIAIIHLKSFLKSIDTADIPKYTRKQLKNKIREYSGQAKLGVVKLDRKNNVKDVTLYEDAEKGLEKSVKNADHGMIIIDE